MIGEIEHFESGWHGIHIGFDLKEIDRLIDCLQSLKERKADHFHMFSDYNSDDKGIGDIEFFLKEEDKADNMTFP